MENTEYNQTNLVVTNIATLARRLHALKLGTFREIRPLFPEKVQSLLCGTLS